MLFSPDQFLGYSCKTGLMARDVGKSAKPLIESGQFSFYCTNCNQFTIAKANSDWNLRNQVHCSLCGFAGRERHIIEVIDNMITRKDSNIALFEHVTSFSGLIRQKYKNTFSSEYLSPTYVSGQVVQQSGGDAITHRDIMNTEFDDGFLDFMIHCDVYEHIPNIRLALKEAYRVLKLNGRMIFTMPLYDRIDKTIQRSYLDSSGDIIDLLPRYFHGNPLSDDGALVYFEPGKDFFDLALDEGFDIRLSLGYDPLYGYFTDCHPIDSYMCWNLVFIASKIIS